MYFTIVNKQEQALLKMYLKKTECLIVTRGIFCAALWGYVPFSFYTSVVSHPPAA